MRYATSAVAFLVAAAPVALPTQQPASALRVADSWARSQADSSRPSGGYATLANGSADTIVVTQVRCEGVGRTEIHETTTADGMMRMRRIPELVVLPGATVTMRPGGLHLMLMDLAAPLVAGQSVSCRLTLRSGALVPLTLAIRAP
jgi:copper(I)-binding protein